MTKTLRTLQTLLIDIYERYGRYGSGIEFFAAFGDQLQAHDPSEVVAQQVKSYPLLYVTDFLLSCPALLDKMDSKAWSRALVSAGPRPELRPQDIQMEQQGDIYFLCKFLRLDAVQFALKCEEMPLPDKEKILRKAQLTSPLLVLDELDREDLDGDHFVSQSFLQGTANRLYAEGGWSRLPNSCESIIARFQEYHLSD